MSGFQLGHRAQLGGRNLTRPCRGTVARPCWRPRPARGSPYPNAGRPTRARLSRAEPRTGLREASDCHIASRADDPSTVHVPPPLWPPVRRSGVSTRLRSFGYTSRRATSTSCWTSTNNKPATPARQRAFLEAFIDHLLRHRSLVVSVFRDLAVLARPAIGERADERRRRMEQLLTGTDLDFNRRVRVSVAFGGLQAAISQHPDASQLRAAAQSAARDRANPAAPPSAERPRHGSPFEATVPDDPKPTPPLRMSHRTPDPPGNGSCPSTT